MPHRIGKCLLRQRLKEARLTQTDLAERLGMSVKMINHYTLNRRVMSLAVAKKIADVLRCTIEDLYTWEADGRKGKE